MSTKRIDISLILKTRDKYQIFKHGQTPHELDLVRAHGRPSMGELGYLEDLDHLFLKESEKTRTPEECRLLLELYPQPVPLELEESRDGIIKRCESLILEDKYLCTYDVEKYGDAMDRLEELQDLAQKGGNTEKAIMEKIKWFESARRASWRNSPMQTF